MDETADVLDANADVRARYLDLVKRILLRQDFEQMPSEFHAEHVTGWRRHVLAPVQRRLAASGVRLVVPDRPAPFAGETMLSIERLDNVQACVESVLQEHVPGDLIETGVWRGGTTILMRAVLASYGVGDRTVWAADSFEGFPSASNREHSVDRGVDYTAGMGQDMFRLSVTEVERNFRRYGLLDDQVRFLVGWFSETLPQAPIERLALIRLDGDMYASTWDALRALYPKLSVGGYVIVDDYGFFEPCRRAVHDFRIQEHIDDPIEPIDDTGVFWRRSG